MAQSVDTKIVELKFNNDNFSDKVESTLEKLDALNKSIDKDGLGKSLKNLTKGAKSVDLSNISNSVDEATRSFSKLEIFGITAMANLSNSVVNFGKKMVKNLINPIVQGGIKRAMNIQQASFQFAGLNVGKSEGNENLSYYKEVMDAVDGTAYSYDAAARAASQLATSNIGVEETTKKLADGTEIVAKRMNSDMYDALLAISGVAAMSGAEFEQISDIFLNAAGKGAAMGDEFRRLSINSINGYQIMAEYYGKTNEEVRKMASQGKISFNDFSKAMKEAFGDHAKDANDLFQGSLSNMKSALARIGAEIADPALTGATQMLNSFTPLINVFKNQLLPYLQKSGNIIDQVSSKVSNMLDFTSYSLMRFTTNDEGLEKWISSNLNIWVRLADAFRKDNDVVYEAIHGLYEFGIQTEDGTKKIKGFTMIADYLGLTLDEVKEGVNNGTIGLYDFYRAFKHLLNQSSELKEVLNVKDIDKYVLSLANNVINMDELTKHYKTLSNVLKGFGSILKSVHTIFLGFSRIALTIIDHLSPLGPLVTKTITEFSKFVVGIADAITTTSHFTDIVDSIVALIVKLFNALKLDQAAPAILTKIGQAFDFMSKAIYKFYEGLTNIVTTVNSIIGKFIDAVLGVLENSELMAEIFENLKTAGITIFFIRLLGVISKPVELLDQLTKGIDDLGVSIKGIFSKVGDVFKSIAELGGKIGKVIDEVTTTLQRMQQLLVASAILAIALSIAVLAGALYLLSKIKIENAVDALMPLGGLATAFGGIITTLKTISDAVAEDSDFASAILKVGAMFLAVSVAMLIIAGAIKLLSTIDPKSLLLATAMIELVLFTLTGIAKMLTNNVKGGLFSLFSRTSQEMTKGLFQLIFIAYAVKIVAQAIATLAQIQNVDSLVAAWAVVEVLMFSMAGIVKWLSSGESTKMAKGTTTLIAMALTIRLLQEPIKELAKLAETNPAQLLQATILIGALMIVMAACTKLMSGNKKMIGASVALIAMAYSIKIVAEALQMFTTLDPESMMHGWVLMAASLAALVLALDLIQPESLLGKTIAILAITHALKTMSEIVMMFGEGFDSAWKGLIIAAGALTVLGVACWAFSKVPIFGILKLFLALAAGVVVLMGFGIAIGIVGVGLSVFSAALSGFAETCAKVAANFTDFFMVTLVLTTVMAALTLIGWPAIAVLVALGVAFLALGAGMALLGSGLQNVAAAIKIMTEIDSLLGSTAKNITVFVKDLKTIDSDAESVGKSIDSMTTSIDKLQQAAITAASSVNNFVKVGQTMGKKIVEGINSTNNTMRTTVNAVVILMVNQFNSKYNDFYSTGAYMAEGLVDGLNSKAYAVSSAAAKLSNKATSALQLAAEVKSPSRLWMRIGGFMGEGLAIGLNNSTHQIETASEGLASVSESAIRMAIESISDSIENDWNLDPVIKPVVDLSDVSRSASYVSSAFGGSSIGVSSSLANSIGGRIQNGSSLTAISKLANKIDAMTESMNSRSLNNYITVDGASDPEMFANDLLRSFKLNARTV